MAGTWSRGCVIALISVGGLLAAVGDAAGQHHDDDAPVQAIVVAPRAEARLGSQEAVITYVNRSLVVYLQRYVDGVPTTGADIELVVDFLPSHPEEIAPGVYVANDVSLAGNRDEVELSVTIDGRTDSAVLPLITPAAARAAGTAPRAVAVPGIVFAIAAAAIFAGVNALFFRRAARRAA